MSEETEAVVEAELQPHEPSPGEVEARDRVRAEAEGMTHHQAASALARVLDDVGDAAAADAPARAALAEWHRITDLLAGHGGPYTTGADPYVQGQLTARHH
ncbi:MULTISPECIES: hypothetical protein [Streptomyces]|uniref:hypothetical protein n=1 Tax=Streptomyces TaxID=1883 RepID=UPI000F77F10E|nr:MULTISPECIES: hypothetical protein [Streptomyces]RST04302.1 hypothetical protein EF910_17265 [Streptomyces sp. WAC07149]GLX23272.1 hypothetical protein Slala01_69160 [Streptomyces lavendulae subsp. lavendulae]GLX30735.1 hypothetical protein Slala02_65550 [Streptomyces lavendulae subsp. lavendulae]